MEITKTIEFNIRIDFMRRTCLLKRGHIARMSPFLIFESFFTQFS